ncbi:MAG: alpha/beta fold hydrolase [Leptolyngbya sp. SIO1D8]|nr:alpha/beta fold hydrolase [Leptolyngbya sp. SIO1D8]
MTAFLPPWYLKSGLLMTLYIATLAKQRWQRYTLDPEPPYQSHIFSGAHEVPLYGIVAVPPSPKGTVIGTYGITGNLDNQWFLQILGRKAFARGYAVVLFDWRAHGKTAELSPTLTSDGLYEGIDFVQIAAQAKALGCPAPFWFTGYSLGGQLALWGLKTAQAVDGIANISTDEIGGGAVLCPSIDSIRSLQYLVSHPIGRYIEQAITRQLNLLAWKLYHRHPGEFDSAAIERANSIWNFDQELVIGRLGFTSVEDYYTASSPLSFLPTLKKPTFILYAADDPLFAPDLIPELKIACADNENIELRLTSHGGHVGYISSQKGQAIANDPDPWWAWNRVLEWIDKTHQHIL